MLACFRFRRGEVGAVISSDELGGLEEVREGRGLLLSFYFLLLFSRFWLIDILKDVSLFVRYLPLYPFFNSLSYYSFGFYDNISRLGYKVLKYFRNFSF